MSEGQGFFSRWSQRKAEVRQAEAAAQRPVAPPPAPALAEQPVAAPPAQQPPPEPAAPNTPSLADVQALAPGEEVSRFMQRGVDPQVKNAAMKKLFADPHFNVMDGLDTYIDDYSQPDPIPPAMLRQLVQGEFLGLFAEEKAAEEAERQRLAQAAAEPGTQAPLTSPASHADPEPPLTEPPHEDADLRLQQDPAAQPASPEPSPGPDARG